jgi:hypothetical protein
MMCISEVAARVDKYNLMAACEPMRCYVARWRISSCAKMIDPSDVRIFGITMLVAASIRVGGEPSEGLRAIAAS